MMSLLDRFRRKPMEQKSVSLPEVLFQFGRGFPQWQKWDTETAIEEGLKASAIFYACCRWKWARLKAARPALQSKLQRTQSGLL